jgi:hypothetical protein
VGLLGWIFGKAKRPDYEPEPQIVSIDWLAFEKELAVAIEAQIWRFAPKHIKEAFYGFGLDCNASYGDILLCLNTPQALAKSAATYLSHRPSSSLQAETDSLRWALGDWKYHGFNINTREWPRHYGAALSKSNELERREDIEQFMVSACRALLRIERSGILSSISRTDDFRVCCMDHDENILEGDRRLHQLRGSIS